MAKLPLPSSSADQSRMALTIAREVEVDGVGMGVLSDGTAYLTGRGLARLCGVDNAQIFRLTAEWLETPQKPRISRIKKNLAQQGISQEKPYILVPVAGVDYNAYPETVCMAVLEYYAFDAQQSDSETARNNYRVLARNSFQQFIYRQTGYSPSTAIPAAWQQFHDRVSLTYARIPAGYFSIFKELSDMIVTLIQGGASIGSDFIPDISGGQHWSTHWKAMDYQEVHGGRQRYPHSYPPYFPQSASNPQPAYCYPDACLPAFRKWMREDYLPSKLPSYLNSKVRQGALSSSFAEISLRAFVSETPPRLRS